LPMAQPRVYLFYGANSHASSLAIQRWRSLFLEKYGASTAYVIDADELTPEQFVKQLQGFLGAQTLFSEPQLILIKRVTSGPKAATANTTALLKELERVMAGLDDMTTIVIWEEHGLGATHPLFNQFRIWQDKGLVKVHHFPPPTRHGVPKLVNAYLRPYEQRLTVEGEGWLTEQYNRLGKQLRLVKKIKNNEELLDDDRLWWLYQVAEIASLQGAREIGPKELAKGHASVAESIGAFDIAQAVVDRRWKNARMLLGAFAQEAANGDYFPLLAALRWQCSRSAPSGSSALFRYALQLLGHVELLIKNHPVEAIWVFDLWLTRLEEWTPGVENDYLISPRKLWLAELAR
jgi:DNA polymerase III delta subunit